MAWNLITSLLSQATNLLPSITASAHAPPSITNSNNSQNGRARAAEEDMKTLMVTLNGIKATLFDAEERVIRDRYVKHWLKELKKVAYDAEDVLSEYRYEVTRSQVEARKASQASGSHKRKHMESIEHIVAIPDDMVRQIHRIRIRFEEIAKDRDALQLRESDGVRHPNNKILRPETGHMVDEASIFGRHAEITNVINFLLCEIEKSFSVISIVGKGGIGKTTIAQLVYKDARVTQCFDLFGWVCVSEEFDVKRLIKETMESVSKINSNLSMLSPLQEELAEVVKGKRVLLVLDDVWNENQNLWESFRVCFKEVKMVRILVTTRNNKVAKVMQTTKLFRPNNLPESSCWQLFQHYAFSGTSDTVPKQFINMGRNIMKKCCGLPLAVKSIASLLRYETNEESWVEILESDLWESNPSNDIFPALQISYAHLPPHLKPCFLFCSMYPKDYILEKMNLIELWISHGYIESKGKRRITEIGAEYYEELKQRSFLDDDFSSFLHDECCKLHDIIHDLARLNSENEHYSVEINNQPLNTQNMSVPQEVSHLHARGSSGYVNQILPQNLKGLRTLSMDLVGPHKLEAILTKFESLKVLELKGNFDEIPDFIPELKHLVHLGIICSMLPLSIGRLYNLRTLSLCGLKDLPENIGDLANLEFLYIKSPLKNLPKSLCSLSNLQTLSIQGGYLFLDVPHDLVIFPAIKNMNARLRVRNIGWLKDMKDLEGKLTIERLEISANLGRQGLVDAQRANLRNKCKLEILDLCWDHDQHCEFGFKEPNRELRLRLEACEGGLVGANDVDFSLLECLQPHPNLKKLLVRWYHSATVPGWIRDPFSLQSIQQIVLEKCDKIQSIPFGNLRTLKHLKILWCSSMQVRQLEQLPSQLEEFELITGLGDLEYIPHGFVNFLPMKKMAVGLRVRNIGWLKDMKDLEGKLSIEGLGNMSNLVDAQCANLRNKYKLEALDLCWDHGPNFDNLLVRKPNQGLRLRLQDCEDVLDDVDDVDFSLLECLQPHPNLKKLWVRDYPSATLSAWMRDPFSLQSIQKVVLQRCHEIQSLPFGRSLHTLKQLKIKECSSIQVLQLEKLPSHLEELKISHCDDLEVITGLGDMDMLASLDIEFCVVLKSLMMERLQMVESTELFGDSSHEEPHIRRQNISKLTSLAIIRCGLLHVLPDGLIPSGPSHYVCVKNCGCPDLRLIGHKSDFQNNFPKIFLKMTSNRNPYVDPRYK